MRTPRCEAEYLHSSCAGGRVLCYMPPPENQMSIDCDAVASWPVSWVGVMVEICFALDQTLHISYIFYPIRRIAFDILRPLHGRNASTTARRT